MWLREMLPNRVTSRHRDRNGKATGKRRPLKGRGLRLEPLEQRTLLTLIPFCVDEHGLIEVMAMDSPPTRPVGPESTMADSPGVISQSAVLLNNVPTSTWTYGCSATSAGMIFGYYDRTGYPNMYTGPTNGGVAPLTDLGQGIGAPIPGSCSIIATQNGFDGLVGNGHVDDYWISYNSTGPDPWEGQWPEHSWSSCTADFLGTNQWKWDFIGNDGVKDFNVDGGTALFMRSDNAKLYDYVPPASSGLPQTEMTHGLRLFAESRGYSVQYNAGVGAYEVYTQKTDNQQPGGFSFADFQAEINAGRPVMVQVEGHTMVGMGYDAPTNTIYIHDTWDNAVHTMPWGGNYYGMNLVAITVLHLAPPPAGEDFGDAPDPSYPTVLASNGARHTIVSGFSLGASVDAEANGQPNGSATGDDLAGLDDEDGVVFGGVLTAGAATPVTVTASQPGFLDAWVDFNDDGDWADPGEQVFASRPLSAGANALSISVPAGTLFTPQTFARFRFSSTGGLLPTGAAADGEVEDYAVAIAGRLQVAFGMSNQIRLVVEGGMLTVYRNGIASESVPAGLVSDIVVAGSAGNDTLIVDLTGGNPIPAGGIAYDGGGQTGAPGDSLVVAKGDGSLSAVTYNASGPGQGSVVIGGRVITFTGLEPVAIVPAGLGVLEVNITDGLGHVITLSDDGTPGNGQSMVDLDGGLESATFTNPATLLRVNAANGNNTITLAALDVGFGAAVELNGGAANDDFVIDDNGAAAGGTVYHVSFPVSVNGGGGANNTLLINAPDSLAADIVIDQVSVTNLGIVPNLEYFGLGGSVTYAGLSFLRVVMGDGGNSVEIDGTAAGTTTRVESGAGDDSFTAGAVSGVLDDVLGPLEIAAGAYAGFGDVLDLLDFNSLTADTNIVVTATSISGAAPAPIAYQDVEEVALTTPDRFGATVTMSSSSAAFRFLLGDGGTNTLRVGTGDMDLIGGRVDLLASGAPTRLLIDDSADPDGDSVTIDLWFDSDDGFTKTRISGLAASGAAVLYEIADEFGHPAVAVDGLEILAGAGNDSINVVATTATDSTTIDAGAGNDSNTITINADALTGDNAFLGGTGDDRFVLNITSDVAGTSLVIDGGDDTDALEINDTAVVGRSLSFEYPNPGSVDGSITVNGFAIPLEVTTMESVAYAGNAAQVTVVGTDTPDAFVVTPTDVDKATVEVTSGSGSPDLSFTGLTAVDGLLIDGSAPWYYSDPGDRLTYVGVGVLTVTGPGEGTITSAAGYLEVRYQEIERVESIGGFDVVIDANDDPSPGDQANDGIGDTFLLVRTGTAGENLEVWINGILVFVFDYASLHSLTINGSGDADTLTVRASGGLIALPGWIMYDGEGLGANPPGTGDALIFDGDDPSGPVARETYIPGPLLGGNPDAGVVVFDPDDLPGADYGNGFAALDGNEQIVVFNNIAPIVDDTAVAQLDILATAAAEGIGILDGVSLLPGPAARTLVTPLFAPTFESIEFANKITVTVSGLDGGDVFQLNNPNPADGLLTLELYGNELPAIGVNLDDAASDWFDLIAVGGAVGNARLFGQSGDDVFTNSLVTPTLLLDGLEANLELVGGPGSDSVVLQDLADLSGDWVTLTDATLTGAAPGAITYSEIESFAYEATDGDDIIDILSTALGTVYGISGNGGSDTFTVGTDAASFGTGVGSLDAILGPITFAADFNGPFGTQDTLNIDDSGDPDADVASIDDAPGGLILARTTTFSGFAPATIAYEYTPGAEEMEFVNIRAGQGGNTITVNATTASNTFTLDSGTGNDANTVTISGDALSGTNLFTGNTGNDRFVLNIADDLGAAAVFSLTGLWIEGNQHDPLAPFDARDRLEINDLNVGSLARNLAWAYGFWSGDGSLADGRLSGFAVPIDVFTMETVSYAGDTGGFDPNNDTLQVLTTPSGMDKLAFVPTGAHQGLVFLGGDPWAGPPADFYGSLPGVAGGGLGPDLRASGLRTWDGIAFAVPGGLAKLGDQLYVYAVSELNVEDDGDQVDGNGNVVIPGAATLGLASAFDNIWVGATYVQLYNRGSGTGLLVANIDGASFRQSSYLTDGLIVNAGFEAAPDGSNLADWVSTDFVFDDGAGVAGFPVRVNGGDPVPAFAPAGDMLRLFSPGDITVYSDASNPPVVTVTATDPTTGYMAFPIRFSSMENVLLEPGTGVVNIIGDNNTPGTVQHDYYRIIGRDVDFNLGGDADGAGEFQLEIGTKAAPGGAAVLSAPIFFTGVTRINVFGGSLGETSDTGVDTLDITPFANNEPLGWGIEIYFDEGDPDSDEDMLLVWGVEGVSERFVVQPSAPGAGQVAVTNSASGTPIAVINYTTNTGLEIVGNGGSAGDTDRLILRGTDGVTQSGTSGDEAVIANFAASGLAGDPIVSVRDSGSPGAPLLYQLFTIARPLAFDTLYFELDGGDDAMALVNVPGVAVYVDGGAPAGSDTLTVTVPGNARVRPAAGVIDQAGVGAIQFVGIERVNVEATAAGSALTVLGTEANDTVRVEPGAAPEGTVAVNGGPAVGWNAASGNFERLVLELLGGDDSVEITPIDGVRIDVNAGSPAGSDRLILNAVAAGSADGFVVTPTGQGAGLIDATAISAPGLVDIAYTGIEELVLVHQLADGDSSQIDGTLGNDLFEYYHGLTPDASTVVGLMDANNATGAGPFALPTIRFLGIDPGAAGVLLNANVPGGTDTLVLHGTAGDDAFSVVGSTVTNAVNGVAVAMVDVGASSVVVVEGAEGDDTFAVVPSPAYAVVVRGGNPGASDVLNFVGTGAAVLVDLAAQEIFDGVMLPVSFSGIERITTDAAGGDVTVWGTPGDDAIAYSPTGADSGQFTLAGLNALLAVSSVGTLAVDGLGGSDALTVNATQNADTITIDGTLVSVDDGLTLREPLVYSDFEALAVYALAGDDTFRVTPAGLPIFVDGGDPIGTTPGDRLTIIGGPAIFQPGPETDEGAFLVGANARVSFDHIEGFSLSDGGTVVITGTNGDDDITVIARDASTHAGADGYRDFTVSVNDGLEWLFIDIPTLYIDAMAGDDDIVIRAPAPNGVDWGVEVYVVGGTPAASDTLVFETPGTNAVTYTPTGGDTGTLRLQGLLEDSFIYIVDTLPPIPGYVSSPGGIEHLIYDGQSGGDDLTVVLTDGLPDVATYAFDPITGRGSVEVNRAGSVLLPLEFQNLSTVGDPGSVTVSDPNADLDPTSPAADYLIYLGTFTSDMIEVSSTGTITNLSGDIFPSLAARNIETLGLEGREGDDLFTIAGNTAPMIPFGAIYLRGGDPDASDVLEFTASGLGDVILDLESGTILEQSGPILIRAINVLGIEDVRLNAAGMNVIVNGASRDDALSFAPTGVGAGTLSVAGLNTVFGLSNVPNLGGLMITGGSGGVDAVTVQGNASGNSIGVARGLVTTVAVDGLLQANVMGVASLVVAAGLGDDWVDVSGSGGPALSVDGGGPAASDVLHVATASATVAFSSQPRSGVIYASEGDVSFLDVELIELFGDATGDLILLGSDGGDTISQDGQQVTVNEQPRVYFDGYVNLSIYAGAGDDAIEITPATLPDVSGFYVDGGGPTASDKLVVNGTAGADTIEFTPTAADTGSVTITGAPVISFTGTESVLINGQGGGDDLNVVVPSSEIRLTPGATHDSGVLAAWEFASGAPLVPMQYANLGDGSLTIRLAGGGRGIGLDVHGTASDDQFAVDAAGTVQITKPAYGIPVTVPINTPGVALLRLIGHEGDDRFDVSGAHPFDSGIEVQGGDPSASDTLNFTGSGAGAVTLDLGLARIQEAGFAPVSFSGIETLNADAALADLTVSATGAYDVVTVTPLSPTGGVLQTNGVPPVVWFVNAGTFTVNLLGGNDQIIVKGSAFIDAPVTVSDAMVLLPGRIAVNFEQAEALTVLGLEGDDVFDVAPGAIPIFIDGGDPIGTTPGDRLNILAGGQTVLFEPGPETDEGAFLVAGAQRVSFDHIEGFNVVNSGPVVITGTNGDDDITVIARVSTTQVGFSWDYTVSVNRGPEMLYIDAPLLYIDGRAGDDDIVIRTLDPATGQDWDVDVHVAGGPPSASDTLVLETPGSNRTHYTPTGNDTGNFRLEGSILGLDTNIYLVDRLVIPGLGYEFSPGGIERLFYDGEGADDVLGIEGTPLGDTFVHTPGEQIDAGRVMVNSLLPIQYQNLGAGGSVSIDDSGGDDTLVVEGTALSDSFNVAAGSGAVILNDRLPVRQTGVENLILQGLEGDEDFLIALTHPYDSVRVEGGSPGASDVLTVLGADGTDEAFIVMPGFANGDGTVWVDMIPIDYTGVEHVLLRANAGDADSLTINDDAADNAWEVFAGPIYGDRVQIDARESIDYVDFETVELANTFGTDVFRVHPSDLVGFDASLTVSGDGDDVLEIVGTGTADIVTLVTGEVSLGTTVAYRGIGQLNVLTLEGDDQVLVDVDAGSGSDLIGVPIAYDGGVGHDTLTISGTPVAGTADSQYTPGPAAGQGRLVLTGGATTMIITFTGLEPVVDLVPGTLTVSGTNADNAINYTRGSVAARGLVSVDGFETIEFSNKTTLTLNGGAGNDVISIANPARPTGLTGITVNGGDPSAGDRLIVHGQPGLFDPMILEPAAQGAGTVHYFVDNLPSVAFTGTEALELVGQSADGDVIGLDGTVGDDFFEYLPGPTSDVGTVVGTMDQLNATGQGPFPLVPVSFRGVAQAGGLWFNAFTQVGGADTFVFNGTAANDVVSVYRSPTGIGIMNSLSGGLFASLSADNMALVVVQTHDGDDVINVAGNVDVPVTIAGGSPDASDVLNFTGTGGAVQLDLAARRITQTGFSPVTFVGIEQVNLNAAGGNLTVLGTSGDDAVDYTPTGTDAGQLALAALNTRFNLSAVGGLTLNTLSGTDHDTVTVHGNNAGNAILVARGATTTVLVDALLAANVTGAEALVVAAELGNDVISVTGSGGPALTVDGGLPPASQGGVMDVLSIIKNLAGETRVIPGATPDSGVVDSPDGAVSFLGIERVELIGRGAAGEALVIQGTQAPDVITAAFRNGANEAAVNDRAVVAFDQFLVLRLEGLSGNDTFDVWPVGMSAVSLVDVRGGEPAASDTLIVSGTSAANVITFTPTAMDAGSVTAGGVQVAFQTTEAVVIDGQGGGDTLNVLSPSTSDSITFTPGPAVDAGSVRIGTLVPMRFEDLGASGSVNLQDTGGAMDTLIYDGTAGNDAFTVTAATINLTASEANVHVPVTQSGIERLILNGLDGSDQFTINATTFYSGGIRVHAGDPSGSDHVVLNATSAGDTITLTLFSTGDVVTGIAGGLITLVDVENLTINSLGGNDTLRMTSFGGATDLANVTIDSGGDSGDVLTVVGSIAQDTITATPVSATTVIASANGGTQLTAILGAAVSSTLTFDLASADLMVVNASPASDNPIAVSDTSVRVPGRKNVNLANARSLTVNGLPGEDWFDVTPSATVPIFIDGGDPIGVTPGDRLNVLAGGNPVIFEPGPESDEGAFRVGSRQRVSFDHIEGLGVTGASSILILGTNADDDITIIARDADSSPQYPTTDGQQDFTVSVNAGPEILFVDTAALYVDALAGDDDIVVRTPAPDANGPWNVQLFVNGGPPAADGGRLGDILELETPGDTNVDFAPTGADTGLLDLPAEISTIVMAPFTFTLDLGPPAVIYYSSPGGVELVQYDGANGVDNLEVVLDSLFAEFVVYRFDPSTSKGSIEINAGQDQRLPIYFENISNAGRIEINDTGALGGPTDELVYVGTNAYSDVINVSASGIITNLLGFIPLAASGLELLCLQGLDGDDTFTINAGHPFNRILVDGGNPSASDVLNLVGTAGVQTINANLATSEITGFGGTVSFLGVEQVNMDGVAGADTLTVNLTSVDDRLTYTPTGAAAGTFQNEGANVVFTFTNIASTFTVNGQAEDGDELIVVGTNNHDVITVNSPARTVSVENASGTILKPVVLGATMEVVTVQARLGNDTILVVPHTNVDPVPQGRLPWNLLVNVDGGPPGASDALVIARADGSALAATDFVVVNRGRNPNEGTVRVFRNAVPLPDISYKDVEIVSPVVFVAANGDPNLLIMGPDMYEPNEYRANAAYLGSGSAINVANLSIFPGWGEHRYVVADEDYFRVVALETGTLDIRAYFRGFGGLLPGGGDLDLFVYDASGNLVTGFGSNETSTADNDERIRIPVVAGQTYYVHVSGAGGSQSLVTNAYSLSVINTPPPVPYDLELYDVIATASVVAGPPLSATQFRGDAGLSATDGFYTGKYVHFLSGPLTGQRALVTSYAGATRQFTVAAGLSGAPAVGNTFQIESGDTGRSQFDNTTRDNTPTIFFRLDDAIFLNDLPGNNATDSPPDQVIPIPFRGTELLPGYRIAVFDEGSTPPQTGTPPQTPLGYATAVAGSPGVYTFTTPVLSDGSHFLTARVEMIDPATPTQTGFGARSLSLEVIIDTGVPPVYFGNPVVANDGLSPDSDTGIAGQPLTFTDRITSDTTPTFWGMAEANAVVRLYADLDGNGLFNPSVDLYLGQTVAIPLSGTNQFPDGQWTLTSNIDLNNPAYFPGVNGQPRDGLRTIFVTAEDLSGNLNPADPAAVQVLSVFLDTRGPQVNNVSITGHGGYDLFDPKPSSAGPTPPATGLDIDFIDQPVRAGQAGFVYAAVNRILATTPGNIILVGDANGVIPIQSIEFLDHTVAGDIGRTTIRLYFYGPLPDDRYTLTVYDRIKDDPGNALDGESHAAEPQEAPVFPSGDRNPGGSFVARFTIDTRPEIGTWGAGSVWVDTNGNFSFDPQNTDYTNRDLVYQYGITSDDIFVGNFSRYAESIADGFDKLGAYGRVNNQYRWLIDVNNDGAADIDQPEPSGINGLPIAGEFDGNRANGDEVGLVVNGATAPGSTWYFDTNHDYQLNTGQALVSQLQGFPFVADFNGDGYDDLGTWQTDAFRIDLAGPIGANGLRWDGVADVTIRFGFIGVRERPVAADMNADGYADLGLWVPDRPGMTPGEACEWYFLMSGPLVPGGPNQSILVRPDVLSGTPQFKPIPLGNDLFAQFGDEFAAPLVGNFDPPLAGVPRILTLEGTPGNDLFEFVGGTTSASWTVKINGVAQILGPNVVGIEFFGLSGNDKAVLTGTSGDDNATLGPLGVTLSGPGYQVSVSGVETITVLAGAGNDTAVFSDSPANDKLVATPTYTSLTGPGFSLMAKGFETVSATSSAGGRDVAHLKDSLGDDTFVATPQEAKLSGVGFSVEARSFSTVIGYASGGRDVARLSDSSRSDNLGVSPTLVTLAGYRYLRRASGFEEVYVTSAPRDNDSARLYDSAGDDTLTATPTSVRMTGPGFVYEVAGFEAVTAYASSGKDVANLYDSTRDDTFTANPTQAILTGTGYRNVVNGFDQVLAYASRGTDVARLYDSAGDDTYLGQPTQARLYGTGFYLLAKAFDSVYAYASSGHDVAKLYGSEGDDALVADSTYAKLSGAGFLSYAKGFDEVLAYGLGGSGDRADLYNASLQRGTALSATLPSSLRQILWLRTFEQVRLRNQTAQGGTSTINAVDEVFRAFWT